MTEIRPAKSNLWEPIIGDTFESFLKFVREERGISDDHSLNIIKNNALNILKRCVIEEDENDFTKRTTLHLGEVQSGKTLTMCSAIALAYDNNFLISTILTGTKNILKAQNQDRIKEVLNAIDSGNTKFIYYSEPTDNDQLKTQLKDLTKKKKFIANKMIVFTMLKHQNSIKRLSKIFTSEELNVSSYQIRSLILDDEADQASPNTQARKNKRSPINNSIIELRKDHPKFCTYIQVTATAQPLFLIDKDDPMSPDFISVSDTPKAYIGIKNYFLTKKRREKFVIKIEEDDIPEPDDSSAFMPQKLQEALDHYIVATAISETLEKPLKPPFTFLCHPDWRKEEHNRYEAWIRKYINKLKEQILDEDYEENAHEALKIPFEKAISNLEKSSISYEKIKNNVGKILESNIAIRIINDKFPIEEANLKDFWNKSNYHIIIGGNCIERGFTVEGILVTYMSRNPGKNSDSIQQRARFCGFKNPNHFLLSRLWLDEENITFFKKYILHEETIRKSIQENINEYKPHAKEGFEMPLVKPFQLTRKNVHGDLNIGDAKEWFKTQYGQYLTREDQLKNYKLSQNIFQEFKSSFRRSQNPRWRCFESNQLTIFDLKKILNQYRTYEVENAPKNFYSKLIECYTDEYKDTENISTFLMVDTDAVKYESLDDYLLTNPLSKLVYERNITYPKDIKLPKTNPHRGPDKKGGFNWLGDSDVFSERKISLQIMLLKYGLSDKKGIYNERKEMHKKIDNLINTEETMLICMKFKDLKHWRIFNI